MKANREVILSAGAIGSPHILQVSGIGESEKLKERGIKTIHELKGVGKNLQDHLMFRPCLLYTSDAADDSLRVDLGGRRIIKKSN